MPSRSMTWRLQSRVERHRQRNLPTWGGRSPWLPDTDVVRADHACSAALAAQPGRQGQDNMGADLGELFVTLSRYPQRA